jgi:hypothetical protein
MSMQNTPTQRFHQVLFDSARASRSFPNTANAPTLHNNIKRRERDDGQMVSWKFGGAPLLLTKRDFICKHEISLPIFAEFVLLGDWNLLQITFGGNNAISDESQQSYILPKISICAPYV